jgi:hypothetical protein
MEKKVTRQTLEILPQTILSIEYSQQTRYSRAGRRR